MISILRTLCFLVTLSTCGQLLAESPVFRNGLLTLPVVDDAGDTLTLELELVASSFPPEFVLTFSRQVFAPVDINTPWFDDDFLVIPELTLKQDSYTPGMEMDGAKSGAVQGRCRSDPTVIPGWSITKVKSTRAGKPVFFRFFYLS